MSISLGMRLSAVLPEVFRFARLRRRASGSQLAVAGVRLGGIFAWGIEQARFIAELLEPAIADACVNTPFPECWPSPVADINIVRQSPADYAAIAVFQATGDSGRPLRVLIRRPRENEKLAADAKLIESLVALLPRHERYVSKRDLVRLIEDITDAAKLDGDLAEEARGLSVAARSHWFEAPELVLQSDGVLVETDLAGVPLEDLPSSRRAVAYRDAVLRWTRMLLDDGIIAVTLRRDSLRLNGDQLQLIRWAGTRQSSTAAEALIRSLILAAFDCTPRGRATARERASRLLAEGFGLAGSLEEIETLCLSLISDNDPLDWRASLARIKASRTEIRQSDSYSQERRIELFQVLRQLIWFRDLGSACGVSDLSHPWRELAPEIARRSTDN